MEIRTYTCDSCGKTLGNNESRFTSRIEEIYYLRNSERSIQTKHRKVDLCEPCNQAFTRLTSPSNTLNYQELVKGYVIQH